MGLLGGRSVARTRREPVTAGSLKARHGGGRGRRLLSPWVPLGAVVSEDAEGGVDAVAQLGSQGGAGLAELVEAAPGGVAVPGELVEPVQRGEPGGECGAQRGQVDLVGGPVLAEHVGPGLARSSA